MRKEDVRRDSTSWGGYRHGHTVFSWRRLAKALSIASLVGSLSTPLVGISSASASGSTLYVVAGAIGTTCASPDPTSACPTISYALTQATSGDIIAVSGTIFDSVSISSTITIEQMSNGLPAVLHGNGFGPVVYVSSGGNATLDELTITGGSGSSGGGILINGGGNTVTVNDSTISGNVADALGGGIAGAGGGAFSNGGTLVINDSTIAGNTAQGSSVGPFPRGGKGGGIFENGGSLTISDSTISGNAVGSAAGGGPGSAGVGAGIYFNGGADALAGDILATPGGPPTGSECAGASFTDAGYNVDDDGSCQLGGTGSVSNSSQIDSFLGILSNNGGPTPTISLSVGGSNPAEAAIPAGFTAPGQSTSACNQSDQRGISRITPCDMGSFAHDVVPSAPGPLSASSVANSIELALNPPASSGGPSISGYTIYRGTAPGNEGVVPLAVLSSATTYDDQSVSDGTNYYYRVSATNSLGESPKSNEASASLQGGYWLVSSDGGVFSFGTTFFGSAHGVALDQPMIGMASTTGGRGYWLVATDGGVFAYGDAGFHGSVPALRMHISNIVGVSADAATGGYWLVGADGGYTPLTHRSRGACQVSGSV